MDIRSLRLHRYVWILGYLCWSFDWCNLTLSTNNTTQSESWTCSTHSKCVVYDPWNSSGLMRTIDTPTFRGTAVQHTRKLNILDRSYTATGISMDCLRNFSLFISSWGVFYNGCIQSLCCNGRLIYGKPFKGVHHRCFGESFIPEKFIILFLLSNK